MKIGTTVLLELWENSVIGFSTQFGLKKYYIIRCLSAGSNNNGTAKMCPGHGTIATTNFLSPFHYSPPRSSRPSRPTVKAQPWRSI